MKTKSRWLRLRQVTKMTTIYDWKNSNLKLKMTRNEVSTCFRLTLTDIQEIEKNIHLENAKLTEKTVAQRYSIDYYKREIANLKEMNKNFKRDININHGTE